MDARSRLNEINCRIKEKLESIQMLVRTSRAKSLDVNDDFEKKEYQRHQNASRLFYYSLMVAYGNLAVKAILDRVIDPESGKSQEMYKHYDKSAAHELFEAERLLDGYARLPKDSISNLRVVHQSVIELFKAELDKCQEGQLSDLFRDHVQGINLGLIGMAFMFYQDKERKDMRSFVRRMLTLVTAIDFVSDMQFQIKERVFQKLKRPVGKESVEFTFFQKMFSGDEVDNQGIKIKTKHPFSTEDLFKKLKEMIDTDNDAVFENLVLYFKEIGANYGIAAPSKLQKTPDEARADSISKKLNAKLNPLKARYLGVDGEFARIDAFVEAVVADEPLPPQDGHLAVYATYLKQLVHPTPMNKPAPTTRSMPKRPRMDTGVVLDRQISSVLHEFDETTTSTDQSPLLSRKRSNSRPEEATANTESALPRQRSRSHLAVDHPLMTPAPVGSVEASLSNAKAARKPSSAKPETLPYRRPSTVVYQPTLPKPSMRKYILIGLGVGFLVAGAVALSVGLAFAFGPAAPAVLTTAFVAATKLLATTAIGTWSTVAAILAFPPIAGLGIAWSVWRRKCTAILAPITSSVTRAIGSTTHEFFHSFHSEPARRPSFKMHSSPIEGEDGGPPLPPSVVNASTLYPRAVSPTPGAPQSPPKSSFRPK